MVRPTKREQRERAGFEHGVTQFERVFSSGNLENILDRRKALGRIYFQIKKELVDMAGGDPTPTQRILIDRILVQSLLATSYENFILRQAQKSTDGLPPAVDRRVFDQYRSLSSMLSKNVSLFGLKGSQRKIPDLRSYLETQKGQGSPD